MQEYSGRVERIVFENEGFYIFTFLTDSKETIKVKGSFPGTTLRASMDLKITGKFKQSKYGNDFNMSSFEEIEPSDTEGIIRYLVNKVKGVGWVTAEKIADHYGDRTVEILTSDPSAVFGLPFLNDSQKHLINKTLTENIQYRDASVFLMSFDVKPGLVDRIYTTFGNDTVEKVTEDPYILTKVRGIAFKRADEIATRMGIDPKSPVRVKAVIKYLLDDVIGRRGHLFQVDTKLRTEAKELVGDIPDSLYDECIDKLMETGDIQIDGRRIYSQMHYYTETSCAYMLSEMMTPVSREFDLEGFVTRFEAANSTDEIPFRLSDEQLQALELALVSKVLVITGLPGTGKTTVLKAIVGMFEQWMGKVALMTPTGISSKRLKQVTGRPAGTIHRTLGCRGDGAWERNQDNPLPVDAVIIDEVSMVDQALFYRLLQGIKREATMILVGDSAQLPSVGPGNVLAEVIKSGCVSTVELTTIHRQEEASDIILNSHRINNGESLVIDTKNAASDFKFFKMQDEEQILERMVYVAAKLREKGVEFQVLSPRHKGTLGVESLNEALKEVLNPDHGQDSCKIVHKTFRVGDRVMVTRNNYKDGVFNGDIGTVVQIDRKEKTIQFTVDGNSLPTVYSYGQAREDVVLAYCVTIHKSQGSEFEFVLLPMVKSFSIQLQRNLFYTAVTRARRKVLVFGEVRAMNKAIANDKVQRRNTVFGARIQRLASMN